MSINYRWNCIRLALLLAWLFTANVEASMLDVTPALHSKPDISLSPYLELLEDPSGQLDITQISSTIYANRFVANTAAVPDMGRTRSVWWARFQLRSDAPQERYLLLDRAIGGRVEAFLVSQMGQSHLQRVDNFRLPAWHLSMATSDAVTVYLRVNNGQALLTLPLKLMDAETLLTSNSSEEILLAALSAGMAVLMLYNLLLFFSLWEYSYLSLTGLLLASNLFFLRDTNLLPSLAWLHDPTQYFYTMPVLLMFATGFHYWRYVNQGASRIMGHLCRWMPYLSLVAIPLMGLVYRGEQLIFSVGLSLMPVAFVLTGLAVRQGHRPSRIAYWALIALIVAAAPYAAVQVGWFTYDKPFVYLAVSGFLLTALLLSFVQAEQTHLLREEKERMEAASKAKDSFLTTMSHELRTPIHAIIGMTDLLRNTEAPTEQATYLNKLRTSARHLQGLVDNVLDLSRINAGRLELETTAFRLDEELEKLHQMFSLSAAQKGLVLSIEQPQPTLPRLKSDPVRLRQVLINLLGNAIKFTECGSVTVSVRQQTTVAEGYTRLFFEVADTGIGISSEQQRHLFQAFSQADSSTARHYGGSGLGLAISHQLVRLMGGKLMLESQPDKGSRFFFTLDFLLDTSCRLETGTVMPSASLSSLAGSHILLVDDDKLNCYLGELMLKRLEAKTTVVNNGQTALQQIEQHTFDLVMMDVSMPDMDGYTTTRHIRHAGHAQLPIIAVTAHAIEGERERCLAAGMNDYLTKPFDLATLHHSLISNLSQL